MILIQNIRQGRGNIGKSMQNSERSEKKHEERVEAYLALFDNQNQQQQTLQFPLNQQHIFITNELDETMDTQREAIPAIIRIIQLDRERDKLDKQRDELNKERDELNTKRDKLNTKQDELNRKRDELNRKRQQIFQRDSKIVKINHDQSPIRALIQQQQSERSIVIQRFPNKFIVHFSQPEGSQKQTESIRMKLTLLGNKYPTHKLRPRKK